MMGGPSRKRKATSSLANDGKKQQQLDFSKARPPLRPLPQPALNSPFISLSPSASSSPNSHPNFSADVDGDAATSTFLPDDEASPAIIDDKDDIENDFSDGGENLDDPDAHVDPDAACNDEDDNDEWFYDHIPESELSEAASLSDDEEWEDVEDETISQEEEKLSKRDDYGWLPNHFPRLTHSLSYT